MENIPELDAAGLKKFALTLALTIAMLFGVLVPWLFNLHVPLWPWLVSGVVLSWSLCVPRSFRILYRTWMVFGQVMNRISTLILLGIIFYLVITPMGFILRRGGKTQIKLDCDETISSYRVSSNVQQTENLKRPF